MAFECVELMCDEDLFSSSFDEDIVPSPIASGSEKDPFPGNNTARNNSVSSTMSPFAVSSSDSDSLGNNTISTSPVIVASICNDKDQDCDGEPTQVVASLLPESDSSAMCTGAVYLLLISIWYFLYWACTCDHGKVVQIEYYFSVAVGILVSNM